MSTTVTDLDLRLPLVRILRYKHYYAEEIRLNMMLCCFVDNLKLAYGGKNSVGEQLGFPSDKAYVDSDSDYALPLGAEFQQMVRE